MGKDDRRKSTAEKVWEKIGRLTLSLSLL